MFYVHIEQWILQDAEHQQVGTEEFGDLVVDRLQQQKALTERSG